MTSDDAKRIIEAALICAGRPLTTCDLLTLFDGAVGADTVRMLLDRLADDYRARGFGLVTLAQGWQLQGRAEMRDHLERLHPERAPRYSRAVIEVLAVIAYRQPVTLADVEEVRGVGVATSVLKQLEDRGWIEVVGQREQPGRPALYATTAQFLADMRIESLTELPDLSGATTPPIFELSVQSPQADVDADAPDLNSA